MPNLFLAGIWLVLSIWLFVWQWSNPGDNRLYLQGSRISLAWFGLVLVIYNLARWLSGRRRKSTSIEPWRAVLRKRRADARPDIEKPPSDGNMPKTTSPLESNGTFDETRQG